MNHENEDIVLDDRSSREQVHKVVSRFLVKQRDSLLANVHSLEISAKYPVGGIVEWYLDSDTVTTIEVLIDVTEYQCKLERLKACLVDLVNIQPLLRSTIQRDGTDYLFVETAPIDDFIVPVFSICGIESKASSIVSALALEMARFQQTSNRPADPQFSCLIIKFANGSTKVLFSFTHKIADAQIFRIIEGYFRMYFAKGFPVDKVSRLMRPYRDFISESFKSTQPVVTEGYKHSEAYELFSNAVSEAAKAVESTDRSGWSKHSRVTIELTDAHSVSDPMFSFGLVLLTSAKFIGSIFGPIQVPMRILWNNRQFSNIKFANTIGDLHDKIPIVVDSTTSDYLKVARDFYCFAKQKMKLGFHFIYMVRRDEEIKRAVYPCPCSLNYFGEVGLEACSRYMGDITKIRLAGSTLSQYNITAFKNGNKVVLILLGGLPVRKNFKAIFPSEMCTVKIEHFR